MSLRQLSQYSFLTVGFAIYAYHTIQDMPIDIKHLNFKSLGEIIESNDVCEVGVKNRQFILRNDSLIPEILRAKFYTFFTRDNIMRFMTEQIQCLHLVDETVLASRFVTSALFMVFGVMIIQLLVVRRMGNVVKSRRKLKQIEEEEAYEAARCIREYIAEKIVILVFCIAQSSKRTIHKRYIDFGEYVRDCCSLHNRTTDITLFSCYYCLLAVCHVSTNSIFRRFITTIPHLERSLMTRLRGQSAYIGMFLALCIFVAYSAILLGGAIVSTAFIHPDYSAILVLECFRAFIRSLYVLDRLAQCASSTCMNEIERQKHLSDKEVAEIVANGFQYNYSKFNPRSIYAVSTLFINLALTIYYALTGLIVNQKILAFGFLFNSNQVINDFVNIAVYDPTRLL